MPKAINPSGGSTPSGGTGPARPPRASNAKMMSQKAAEKRAEQSQAARRQHTGFRTERGKSDLRDVVEISNEARQAAQAAARAGESGKIQASALVLIRSSHAAIERTLKSKG